jgi:hypothetical protein
LNRNERILLGSWILVLILLLGIITTFSGCNGNWIVAGIDISPADSITTDFMIISDQDSIKHWYIRTTEEGGILVGDNWCHRHNQWENVEKK